jgi:tetratricopeptide (TPR) repeat protein
MTNSNWNRSALFGAAALLGTVLATGGAFAVGNESPIPQPIPKDSSKTDTKTDQKAGDKKPADDKTKIEKKSEQDFIDGYKTARAMVLNGEYEKGIAAFHALDNDAHPDVANYLGYAHRKLGQYGESKIWYEKALQADPKHTRTLQYYGMWHLEQGNRLKAQDHLEKIEVICGAGCEDYLLLRKAIVEGKASY